MSTLLCPMCSLFHKTCPSPPQVLTAGWAKGLSQFVWHSDWWPLSMITDPLEAPCCTALLDRGPDNVCSVNAMQRVFKLNV